MSNYMTVFGCTPQKHTRTDWKDYWELVYGTDDQMLFVSKELYNYNAPEENRIFDFNLMLELAIAFDGDDNEILVSNLYLYPTRDYFHSSIKQEIIKDYCMGNEDEIHITDLMNYSQFPILHSERPDLEFNTFDENNEEISKYLLSASIVAETTERIRAIYLDKVINMIGTTNWDLLDGLLHGIDPFKQSLKRVSKQMKGNE